MPEQPPEREREIEHQRELALARSEHRDEISLSGLTRQEAKEFNKFFLVSFVIFVVIAIVAHYLVWTWRPWLQMGAPTSQTSLLDTLHPILSMLS